MSPSKKHHAIQTTLWPTNRLWWTRFVWRLNWPLTFSYQLITKWQPEEQRILQRRILLLQCYHVNEIYLIWICMLYILRSLTGFPLLWHRSNVRVILVSHIIDNYFAISSIYTGDKVCAHPSLDNSSRLLRIIRSKGTDVLYVGDPLLLQYTGNVKETFDKLRTLLRGTWQIWTVINFCSRFWY